MSHRPVPDAAPLHNLAEQWGGDVYTSPEHYSWQPFTRAAAAVLRATRGKPDDVVTVYRAVPASAPRVITTGDWVATTRQYADHHRESQAPVGEAWVVLQADVPVHTVRNGGSDILEWGYWGDTVDAVADAPRTWTHA